MASSSRRWSRTVLALVVFVAVLAALALWLRDSSFVEVRDVTVRGVEGPGAAEIRAALEDAGRDQSTLHVRPEVLTKAVQRYPIVRSVRAETDFPHGLTITVNAREPVAALQSAAGKKTAVAADGTLLRGSSTRGLPVVGLRAAPAGDRVGDAPTRAAVDLLAAAPAALRARVARVFHGHRGLAVTVENGPKLYFGGGARLRSKWSAAAQVLATRSARGASYVDVRVPERPVAGGLKPREAKTQPQL